MRLKNADRLLKICVPSDSGGHRMQALVYRVQRGSRIEEFDLAAASGRCQLRVQFTPAGKLGGQQAKNLGARLNEPKKGTNKESPFGFASQILIWAKEHIRLDLSARAKAANFVRALDSPREGPIESASIAGLRSGGGQGV